MQLFFMLIGFEHIYCRHLNIFMCIRRRVLDPDRELLSLKVLLYIDLGISCPYVVHLLNAAL